ncbi:hypothetical protein E3T34_13590 [Cryobacterium sp. TMT1-62]|uniref:hypothetical protein n=1 Tax=unclassified Cryobacterium TaxID=2649013 RepID=UPI00106CB6AA|nr:MULTISPECIES: hypothetical protein [unclassified Cryobacterium]TFC51367.1 hypothetical protein E3O47_06325 [Cryobacterium sp. TMT2-17-1]TFC69615.1 hypothetical protein E3O54_04900 [Cryobacterium sp. TMT2-4]TFD30231.1 hypothetical protein E3T34_13590 [Cryobacterium sp. TMT1-62]
MTWKRSAASWPDAGILAGPGISLLRVGYLVAPLLVGLLLFGLLHQLAGGWTWPLAFLIGAALAATLAGAVLSCPPSVLLPA